MRLRVLGSLAVAGVLGLTALPSANAATPSTVAPRAATAVHSTATPVWYHWHGKRWRYHWHHHYYNHRRWRHHRWYYW